MCRSHLFFSWSAALPSTNKPEAEIRVRTSNISIETAKRIRQAKTLGEGTDNGQRHAANLHLYAPPVQQGANGKQDEKGGEATVEPIFWQPQAVAFADVPPHRDIRELPANGAPQKQPRARGQVEQAAGQGRREVKAGVDDVSHRAHEAILIEGE